MSAQPQDIDLKGSVFTLLVLHPLSGDLTAIGRQLDDKLWQLPGFFADAPIVIDLQRLEAPLPLSELCDALRARKLVPVGVRNADEGQRAEALAVGLGILPDGRATPARHEEAPRESAPPPAGEPAEAAPEPPPAAPDAATPSTRRPPRIVTSPVRSGQQLYSPGDLILLAPVSSGGEVMADGNIHAYAPLRGRALAGVRGDTETRIFTQALEAELVSVAGHYRLADDFDEGLRGRPVQILVTDERLAIQGL